MSAISISMVAVEDVVPSKDNRRVFVGPDAKNPKLVELAQSIREVGVLEPLLGRPHPEVEGKVELRAGERRLRASRLAGLTEVPVIVREMTDEEAFVVTVVENLQREDTHPIEQAQNIEAMCAHGWSFEQIADKVGKSASWCARRRQLVHLTEKWQEEAMGGFAAMWSAEHLEIIAKFPAPIQDELRKVAKDRLYHWTHCTAAELRSQTASYLHAIQLAPWALDDETLCPKVGACSTCTKRSDTEPLLFDESEWTEESGKKAKPGARCLDAGCWQGKAAAHLVRRLAEVKEKTGTAPVLVRDYKTAISKELDKQAKSTYDFARCKKSEPNARPLVTASGDMYWGKPYGSGGGASNGKGNGDQKGKKTLEEKRAVLQRRRDLAVLGELVKKLPDSDEWAGTMPFNGGMCRRLAAVFGSGGSKFCMGDIWKALEEACSADEAVVDRRLGVMALGVIRGRLENDIGSGRFSKVVRMGDAERVCQLMEWDLGAMRAKVAEELPEPKGWGKGEGKEGKKKGKDGNDSKDSKDKKKRGKGEKGGKKKVDGVDGVDGVDRGDEAKGGSGKKKGNGKKEKPLGKSVGTDFPGGAAGLRKPAGMCKECGCTERNACMNEDGEACGWADKTRTLCTHCVVGRVGLKGTPWEGDVRVNEEGEFYSTDCEMTSIGPVRLLAIEASPGDWRGGAEAVVDNAILMEPPCIRDETFGSRDEAMLAAAARAINWVTSNAKRSKGKRIVEALEAWMVERKMAAGV